ncbi:hypothetical protein [Aeromonas phage 4L372XY]|uniref:Phage tail assembly chaperone-like domain-containing protein n=1 Tax=Aeromonas phage 4L372XY TaxID=2588520 RepID=A0A5B9N864_9CAUD|nr:hypothetical protein HWC28_gp081 [Aeromonas phage 4L372XY]QEG08796.1 hypothetical protein [Aeromonas phage 4L372XY]
MFYIFNADGNLVGTSDYEPNLEDLQTRDEYFTESDQNLIFNRVVGGKYGGIYESVETPEELSKQQTSKIVTQRNNLLNKYDWIVTRHLEEKMTGKDQTLSEEQFVEFLNYRQELRDITKLENFPSISLPETPKFLE